MNFNQAAFEFAAGRVDQLPKSDLPEIVFSGRSNVGKSSFINKLVNRKALARTSATPGKTGTINFYKLAECYFVDLPGYGYAKVSQSEKMRWAKLVEGYFAQERNIKLVMQMIDMRHAPTKDDLQMISFLLDSRLPFIVVATKSDKLNKSQFSAQLKILEQTFAKDQICYVPFSSVNGEGLSELQSIIAKACESVE